MAKVMKISAEELHMSQLLKMGDAQGAIEISRKVLANDGTRDLGMYLREDMSREYLQDLLRTVGQRIQVDCRSYQLTRGVLHTFLTDLEVKRQNSI
jgi:hypothetical protein